MSDHPPAILWLDLETTGLVPPEKGYILEFAGILTDNHPELGVLAEFCYFVDNHLGVPAIRATCQDVVRKMHDENGLWKQYENASKNGINYMSPALIDRTLCEHIRMHLGLDAVGCGGTGITAYDRPWLAHWMPMVSKLFPYFSYDIGSTRRFVQLARQPTSIDETPKPHRAYDDVREAVQMARRLIRNLGAGETAHGEDTWV